jgi:pyrimidine operon attenuation protein/uracil phosphoribosyltransferase
MNKKKILDSKKIKHATLRIAYQIFESNMDEKHIYLVGISENGNEISKRIGSELKKISTITIHQIELKIDKNNPRNLVEISTDLNKIKNKSIVIIDDVLNSGSTLLYSVKKFLSIPLKKIQTVVLVNRNHKSYPVKADFKGISLSTSIKEHVSVVLKDSKTEGVYLS